jgi:hypothetical protein
MESYWEMLFGDASWDELDYAITIIGGVVKDFKNENTTTFINKAEEYLGDYVNDAD